MSYCELLAVFEFLFAIFAIHAIKLCKPNLVLALLIIGLNRIGQWCPRRTILRTSQTISFFPGAYVCLGDAEDYATINLQSAGPSR